jgi:DNA-directed RNA polymerase specialized sigma24 family protein
MDERIIKMVDEKMSWVRYKYRLDKSDTDEVKQKTLLYLLEGINKGRLANDPIELEGYIFISCRNNAMLLLKEKKRVEQEWEFERMPEEESDIESKEEYEIKRNFILDNIQIEIDREIMRMRLENMKFKKIAEITGLSTTKVEDIVNSNKKYLNKIYNNQISKNSFRGRFVYVLDDLIRDEVTTYTSIQNLALHIKTDSRRIVKLLKESDDIYIKTYNIKKVLKEL